MNFVPPDEVQTFSVQTPIGTWTFTKAAHFDELIPKIKNHGACGNTYSVEFNLPSDSSRSAIMSAAFDELLPICLAASFALGMAVTVRQSIASSEIQIMQVGSHFPRDRGLPEAKYCVQTTSQLVQFIEAFVTKYPTLEHAEKLRLLMHFFVDSLSCWSLENLYLSGSTLLQIIASTEEDSGRTFAATHATRRNGSRATPAFFDFLAGAADRAGIAPLNHDVVKTRNTLIHEGTLNAPAFPTQADAAKPIAEAMTWVDNYIYAILGLGNVPVQRYKYQDLTYSLNSFSF